MTTDILDSLAGQIYWHVEHGEALQARAKLHALWQEGMKDAAEICRLRESESDLTIEATRCRQIILTAANKPL